MKDKKSSSLKKKMVRNFHKKECYMKKLLLILLLTGCGLNGEQKITTNTQDQNVKFGGEAYTYVIFRLEFIEQVRQLCADKHLLSDYDSQELYKQAVANCTFDNLALINIDTGAITSFTDQYCGPNANLSGLTPEQQVDILAACAVINP